MVNEILDERERNKKLEAVAQFQAGEDPQRITNPERISKEGFWDYETARAILNEEPEPYLIHGMFRKGSIVTIAATQNAGKTLLLLDIMGSIASGANFLPDKEGKGGFQTEQGPCVFLDFEGDRSDTAARMVATIDTYSDVTGKDPKKDIPILIKYMPMDWKGTDDNLPFMIHSEIENLPEPYNNPSVIAFDTYTAFSNVENENDSGQAQHVFNRLKQLRARFKDTNVTIFITQHLRKLNGKTFENLTMEDIRGAGGAAGAASDIWLLSETSDDSTVKKFRQVKNKARARDEETKVLQFRFENNNDGSLSRARFFMLTGTDAAAAKKIQSAQRKRNDSKKEDEIAAFVATHPNCSISRMCKQEYEDRLKMGFTTVKPLVDRMIASGRIFNLSTDPNGYSLCINPGYIDPGNQ